MALWQNKLNDVEILASGCQDHCDYGPNLLIQPGAIRYVSLDAERARRIVERHLRDGQPIHEWIATPDMRRAGPS